MPNTRKKSLDISMIKNLKSTCQQFLQIWYLELLIIRVIQGNQSLPLTLSQKNEKLYFRVATTLTKFMTKAITTFCNSLLKIKNYPLNCIMLQWVILHLISKLRLTTNHYSSRQGTSTILPVTVQNQNLLTVAH